MSQHLTFLQNNDKAWRDSEIAQVLFIPLLSVRFQLGVRIRNCLFSSRVLSQSNKNLYLLGFSATELKLLIDQHAGLWLSTENSMNCFTLFYVLFGFHTTDKFPQSITGLETGTMTNSYQAKREKKNKLILGFSNTLSSAWDVFSCGTYFNDCAWRVFKD